MKIGIALTLVIACPSVAAAQYGFQLRPSPYRILSGWEQSANIARHQMVEHVTRDFAPVRAHSRTGRVGMQRNGRESDMTGGVHRSQTPHY